MTSYRYCRTCKCLDLYHIKCDAKDLKYTCKNCKLKCTL